MSALRAVAVILPALMAGGLSFLVALRPAPLVAPQPIAFNHNKHLVDPDGPKLACVQCHPGAEQGERAGLPALDRCLQCHMKPKSKRMEETAAREAAIRGGSFAWTQVTHLPGHVHFPHREHVSVAKLECTNCHGDVASWKAPPTEPESRLMDMNTCLDCHLERGASTNCRSCHH